MLAHVCNHLGGPQSRAVTRSKRGRFVLSLSRGAMTMKACRVRPVATKGSLPFRRDHPRGAYVGPQRRAGGGAARRQMRPGTAGCSVGSRKSEVRSQRSKIRAPPPSARVKNARCHLPPCAARMGEESEQRDTLRNTSFLPIVKQWREVLSRATKSICSESKTCSMFGLIWWLGEAEGAETKRPVAISNRPPALKLRRSRFGNQVRRSLGGGGGAGTHLIGMSSEFSKTPQATCVAPLSTNCAPSRKRSAAQDIGGFDAAANSIRERPFRADARLCAISSKTKRPRKARAFQSVQMIARSEKRAEAQRRDRTDRIERAGAVALDERLRRHALVQVELETDKESVRI